MGKAKTGGGHWHPPKGVPNLQQLLTEAVAAAAAEDPDLPANIAKITPKINKSIERFKDDPRLTVKCSSTAAKAIVEEFVEMVMGHIAGACYDSAGNPKPWYTRICSSPDLLQCLLLIVLSAFEKAKIFSRVLKPSVIKYIEEGLFKFNEEERVRLAIEQAVSVSGVSESYQKKCIQAITKGYDEAHFAAPYGTTTNDSAELAVLQDFVKGWITSFVSKAWDVLESGLPSGGDRDSQIASTSVLFQNLLNPDVACMPHEIASEVTNVLGGLPASPWPYVDECCKSVFTELDAVRPAKKPKLV